MKGKGMDAGLRGSARASWGAAVLRPYEDKAAAA